MAAPFIFHPATAGGEGGIALVELYGEGAGTALGKLFRPRGGKVPGETEVRLGAFLDTAGEPVDEVLLASVPGGASWCGLPSWSLSFHGGAFLQGRLRAALVAAGGREEDREGVVALARARGTLDGPRGDALLLLPGCRTVRAARYLLRMAAGELSRRLREAEEAAARGERSRVEDMLRRLLAGSPAARRLTVPRRLLIAGRPNAGKSSLFNRLLGKERAAVTAVPGTTRDLLEEMVEIAGYPVVLIDSAGLRPEGEAADGVEKEGMRRARAAEVDSVLFLIDRPGPPGPDEEEFLARLPLGEWLVVRTKADLWLAGGEERRGASGGSREDREAGPVSARTGTGLAALRDRLRSRWLGPPEEEELPAAPFTAEQEAALVRAAGAPSVDALREALVECRGGG